MEYHSHWGGRYLCGRRRMRYIQGNINPGTNWASRLEAYQSGSYGFEVYNVFPTFVSIPEWPPSVFYGDPSGGIDTQFVFMGASWGNRVRWQGGRLYYGFQGITRDAYGTPLANCIVKLFRTSTNEYIGNTLSDGNGWFQILSIYNDAHFLVAHKSGAPDVEGATVNTILGS